MFSYIQWLAFSTEKLVSVRECSNILEIFSILETQAPGAGNEIQLTDAIDTLNKTQRVFAREFTGDRYDVGDKFGFMKTSIDYALKHPQVKDDMKQYIIDLGKKLDKKKN